MNGPLEQEFETAIRLLREAHVKKVSAKEAEVGQLKEALAKKNEENQVFGDMIPGREERLLGSGG
ncbi:hypothetical protein BDK51DRAFT_50070 [Blyttiomyces helicus]|uniref:Uncharacterized protein n=1 Tax=Blyttiomyces helicus TaxID=388810 RepID=A0A4P9W5M9_9FUNG|nr:hypothetical protein BDK51DRAFT_50070 [Blyttiomyces helicus]|eukprot:RKO86218.1 hypothetical protein BDK51DRAFT_50070 [Blyttiomyces helicus]